MKVIIATDSFKGSLSSTDAGKAIEKGIRMAIPEADVLVHAIADGGEGTVDALVESLHGQRKGATVTGPLGEPVQAMYGVIPEQGLAIIEVASVAGLTLVPKSKRNPLLTTSYGVGELIKDAIMKGCRKFIIGLGGSATNDCGAGMLMALGFGLLNKEGTNISLGAKGLAEIRDISDTNVIPELKECEFMVACDVTNPLCGITGCSTIYGPQKGATPAMVKMMEKWMTRFSELVRMEYKNGNCAISRKTPSSGAAGGLGYAFARFLNGILEPGISLVLRETKLEPLIKDADIVVTGEGKIDKQTSLGKTPTGVAALAKKYGKTVIAFAGTVEKEARLLNNAGIDAYFPVIRRIMSLEEALDPDIARENLTATADQVFRLIK